MNFWETEMSSIGQTFPVAQIYPEESLLIFWRFY